MLKDMQFKHVSYLWDDAQAAALGNDEVGLLIYRSNLLGADLRLTNYGGGNTSCKVKSKDPLTGKEVEVMWVKGSGGDLGTLKKGGLAALYLDRLHSLESIYKGIAMEDQMVELFNHCIYDLGSKAPSIDTPLHAFLPFLHVDHLHPDAAIAIAAAKDGEQITKELFGGKIGWVPWQRPGFDLGLKLRACLQANPGINGIMLGSHGLFTWGDTAKESYVNTLEVIERCGEYIESNLGKKRPVFGGQKIQSVGEPEGAATANGAGVTSSEAITHEAAGSEARQRIAASLAPVLRGFCSDQIHMVGHFTDDPRVLEFINSNDLDRLAPMQKTQTSMIRRPLRQSWRPSLKPIERCTRSITKAASILIALP
jgi:rhamnose utilization protein RhaD (predicted bifunctional aldolase and dehydrogenase)